MTWRYRLASVSMPLTMGEATERLDPLSMAERAMLGQNAEPLEAIAWALISLARQVDADSSAARAVVDAAVQFFTATSPTAFAELQTSTLEYVNENS